MYSLYLYLLNFTVCITTVIFWLISR